MTTAQGDEFAAHIRGELRKRGLTQADLAKALGIPQPSVSRRLTGGTPFTVGELYDIARLFEVQPAELLPLMSERGLTEPTS